MVLKTVSSQWHGLLSTSRLPAGTYKTQGCVIGRAPWAGRQAAPDNVTGDVKAPPTPAVVEYPACMTVPSTCRKGVQLFPPHHRPKGGKALGSDQITLVLICYVALDILSCPASPGFPIWGNGVPSPGPPLSPSQPPGHHSRTTMREIIRKVRSWAAG